MLRRFWTASVHADCLLLLVRWSLFHGFVSLRLDGDRWWTECVQLSTFNFIVWISATTLITGEAEPNAPLYLY